MKKMQFSGFETNRVSTLSSKFLAMCNSFSKNSEYMSVLRLISFTEEQIPTKYRDEIVCLQFK